MCTHCPMVYSLHGLWGKHAVCKFLLAYLGSVTVFLETLRHAFQIGGFRAGLSHIAALSFGDNHFYRPSSLIDFRKSECVFVENEFEFFTKLLPEISPREIENALFQAKSLQLSSAEFDESGLEHPKNWNSGCKLQLVLGTAILILKPETVVETGTANGVSATSIAKALESLDKGHLWTVDVLPNVGRQIPQNLRSRITFVQTNGSAGETRQKLQNVRKHNDPSIFLHDSDHSYSGQYSDYETAEVLGFPFIFSDDIDSSLAFIHFNIQNKVVLIDGTKMIGAGRLRKND
jgi:hypothetical protein